MNLHVFIGVHTYFCEYSVCIHLCMHVGIHVVRGVWCLACGVVCGVGRCSVVLCDVVWYGAYVWRQCIDLVNAGILPKHLHVTCQWSCQCMYHVNVYIVWECVTYVSPGYDNIHIMHVSSVSHGEILNCIHNNVSSMCHAPNMHAEYINRPCIIHHGCIVCAPCTYQGCLMYVSSVYHVGMMYVWCIFTYRSCMSHVRLLYVSCIMHHISSTYVSRMACLIWTLKHQITLIPSQGYAKTQLITCQSNIKATTLKESTMDKTVNVSSQTQPYQITPPNQSQQHHANVITEDAFVEGLFDCLGFAFASFWQFQSLCSSMGLISHERISSKCYA